MPARCWQLCLLAGCLMTAQALQIDREVEHSLDGGDFIPAGKLNGEFKTASRYSTQQQVLEFERSSLPQSSRAALAELVKADREELELHMTDSGGVLAMNYNFASCPCSPEQRQMSAVPASWAPQETVAALVRRSKKIAPLTLLPRTEGVDGKGNKAGPKQAPPVVDPATGEVKEPPKDERSFLQKNWMLILPAGFLLVQLLGGMTGDAGGAAAGAGPQRGARRAASS